MDDWQKVYRDKVRAAPEAIRRVRPGRRLLLGSGAAEPSRLVEALVDHGDHLQDNEIVHLLALRDVPYVRPELGGRLRHTAFFMGEKVRAAVEEGRADFMPVFLSEIPAIIASRRMAIDVALVQVSPPDRHGWVSLGVAVDIVRVAVDTADVVIAEVNPRMPRTLGDSFLHVSRIDHMVPVDDALPEYACEPVDDVAAAIGQHVASLVPHGATIQTGMGRIPRAILEALRLHRDIGVHTEVLSDGIIDLVEAGAVTGRRKTLLHGKIVTSFIIGSQRLYDWCDDNPVVEMRGSGFTNDPMTIARNDRMIAVNTALAVDLTGEVAPDTLLGRFFDGVGGQVDFLRGAARSRGGKPIIALPSLSRDGDSSRIQPLLERVGSVTGRGDVHYVVTEYGIADLWGKSIRNRAVALIDVAHPDYRGELLAAAKARAYVFPDQQSTRATYRWEDERTYDLGKHTVRIRPLRLSDEQALQNFFYHLSDETTYARFMQHKQRHPHTEMQALCDQDQDHGVALVACPEDDAEVIVAMARYDVEPATHLADIAFVVADDWQRLGLGKRLMERMIAIGQRQGLAGFTADTLTSNAAMLGVFRRCGLPMTTDLDAGTFHVVLTFDAPTAGGGKNDGASTG